MLSCAHCVYQVAYLEHRGRTQIRRKCLVASSSLVYLDSAFVIYALGSGDLEGRDAYVERGTTAAVQTALEVSRLTTSHLSRLFSRSRR